MVKPPKHSEVLMYGNTAPAAPRAEIITVGKDGKRRVDQGGLVQDPGPAAKPAAKPAAPAPIAKPAAPAPIAKPAAPAPVAKPAAPPPAAKPAAPAPIAKPAAPPQPAAAKPAAPTPAPKPAVPVANPASAKEVSKAVAANAVGSFVDQMRSAAAANGGMLTIADLDRMQDAMAENVKAIEAQLEAAFVQYADVQERQRWTSARQDVFYRLLVKQFSVLFKERASRKTVSRRMLPGFFMAVAMLLGPDAVESYHDRCRNIVARLKEEAGGEHFDWDAYYADRDALTVSLDAQVLLAAGFADYDRRLKWFLTLVNSHLASAPDGASEAEQRWELAEPGFRRMLEALFINLRKVLSSDKGRERLIKRHGKDTVTDALKTLKRILTG